MIILPILDELRRTVADFGQEEPYAFTLIQGQQCNYLGYAVATSVALSATVEKYISLGYRYHGKRTQSDAEAMHAWLRWANPDDGWHHRDFNDCDTLQRFLDMHKGDDTALRNECIAQLKLLAVQHDIPDITLGVTSGEDPEEFYDSVVQIYGKHGHRNFLTEYDTMIRLDAGIRRA